MADRARLPSDVHLDVVATSLEYNLRLSHVKRDVRSKQSGLITLYCSFPSGIRSHEQEPP